MDGTILFSLLMAPSRKEPGPHGIENLKFSQLGQPSVAGNVDLGLNLGCATLGRSLLYSFLV
jgi:hypothetical protein